MIAQIIFILLLIISAFLAFRQFGQIFRNIRLGKAYTSTLTTSERIKNVVLIAFGQKKMFKRWIPALLHLFIYAAFLLTQIELIEIIVDGIFGIHRAFADSLGWLYTVVINFIEILSLGAFFATIAFLLRRNVLKIPRFHKPEMQGWPFKDGNNILFLELLLLIGICSMNGADVLLQDIDPLKYPETGFLVVSDNLGPVLFSGLSHQSLIIIERFGWWLHIIVVFYFLYYLPRSKHLHIFFAFPNVYFSDDSNRGRMKNMPEIMNEVKSMMGLIPENLDPMPEEIPEFGAKDIFDLSWKNIMDAYTCTECGRCTSVCPANITGKKLSPRKIVMAIRDRADEVGQVISVSDSDSTTFDDNKSLFDYIEREELHACTACNACVEACPVMINPLEPILEMRRYEILTESAGPQEWVPMFTSIENSGSVWQVPEARDSWINE